MTRANATKLAVTVLDVNGLAPEVRTAEDPAERAERLALDLIARGREDGTVTGPQSRLFAWIGLVDWSGVAAALGARP